jgi:predicted helicase
VFDIQQGVAISLFVKQATLSNKPARVSYADVWGKRNGKYDQLDASDVTTTDWQELAPSSPWYLFVPQDTAVREEYERGMKIPNILPINSVGIVTARDSLTIQWTRQAMLDVVQDFVSRSIEDARTHYQLGADARDWKVADAQENLRQQGITEDKVVPMLYRPFDQRYTYYTGKDRGFLCRPRSQVMQHMLHQKNLGLITVRQVAEGIFNHTLVTDCLVESRITLSNKGIAYLFPLYLYPNENNHTHPSLFDHDNGRRPNFSAAFIAEVEEQLGLAFIPDGNGDLAITVGPEDIFHYLYAVLHNPHYRSRYADFLKIDFPHVPITNDLPLFKTLAGYGATLVDLHLLRLPGSMGIGGAGGAAMLENPSDQGVTQHGVTTAPIERVHYDERTQQVTLGQGMYFAGIEPATWAMQVGGYQPLHKWLKDRKGRVLAFAEALHYMRMVVALRETRRVMGEIGEDKAT